MSHLDFANWFDIFNILHIYSPCENQQRYTTANFVSLLIKID